MASDELRERVDAATEFDPWTCQWCAETGFDLRGLAHHVWVHCEVVERLAQENIEDCRRSNEQWIETLRQQHADRHANKGSSDE